MDAGRFAERWLALVNAPTSRDEDITALFAEDALVHFYKEGRGVGEPARFEGLPAVLKWFGNMPREVVVFELIEAAEAEPQDGLPEGDGALRLRYRLIYDEADFENTGTIWMHTRGDQVVGMLQVPEPID